MQQRASELLFSKLCEDEISNCSFSMPGDFPALAQVVLLLLID